MESSSASGTYETYAILIINVLLLLERIFKNGKFFIKCSGSGITFTNRTPPQSPAVSNDNVESPTESPENQAESDPDTSEIEEFRRWKAHHDLHRGENRARKHMKHQAKHAERNDARHKKNTSTEDRE